MNFTAASRTATRAQSVSQLLFAAVGALEDGGFPGCCPVGRMLDLVRTGLRLILVGAASVVLALAGIILSIIAALRRVYGRWRGVDYAASAATEPSSSPLVAREQHAPHKRRPRVRHKSTDASRTPVNHEDAATSQSPSRSPLRASPEPMLPSELPTDNSPPRRRRQRRRVNQQLPELGLPSISSAMEDVEPLPSNSTRPPLDVRGGATGEVALRTLSSPSPASNELSPSSSSSKEPSLASDSAEERARAERSPSPGRRVFQRLREQHTQLRERCLTRVHSMPSPKQAKPARRTDPYQAPYYFPTPLSPDADTYIEQVRNELRSSARVTDPIAFRQYWDPNPLSPRTSPRSKETPLPPAAPEIVVSEVSAQPAEPEPKPEVESRPALRDGHHRWSWHLPLRPHLPGRMPSVDADGRDSIEEKSASHSKFLFGHSRRRNGTSSEEVKSKRTSLPHPA
ncbi:hypothetical protein BV20DRAFT_1048578 [Pilatotrama ljubarskyi]|nr:hypothetical protein BV20DRAFT_1048578 [Pilatotrama ljubarskyi]